MVTKQGTIKCKKSSLIPGNSNDIIRQCQVRFLKLAEYMQLQVMDDKQL